MYFFTLDYFTLLCFCLSTLLARAPYVALACRVAVSPGRLLGHRTSHSPVPQRASAPRTQLRPGEMVSSQSTSCFASHPALAACAHLDRGCASPMQVMAQKTKEAEITEHDPLLLVSLLPISSPFSASIPCDSSGFGRLPPIESLLLG